MMNCNVKKKREKLKKLNLTVFKQPSKLQNCENERCFLLSSYEDSQGWAMMNCNVKKKREKLKKLNFTAKGRENERCFLLSSYEDGQGWAMMNCNVKKSVKS